MNRAHLARWSLELADDEFPPALAALGALTAVQRALPARALGPDGWQADALCNLLTDAIDPGSGILKWEMPVASARSTVPRLRIAADDGGRPVSEPAPEARMLAQVWREVDVRLQAAGSLPPCGLRLSVRTRSGLIGEAMALAGLLALPSVGAAGVHIDEAFPSDGRTDWRWPFTIATLPGDPLSEPFASLQAELPPAWPFRFTTAARDMSRVEVLVIGAGASDALTRVLSSGLQLRCCLVIIAGLGSEPPRLAEPLLRALVARVEAEGVAVLESGSSPQSFAARLRDFADELTHNKTLDVALTGAFRPGALLLFNRDLLALSHLDTTIARVTRRLRELPRDTEVRLSERSFERLGLPRSSMRPAAPRMRSRSAAPEPSGAAAPDELADAIDARRPFYRFDSEAHEASAISELARSIRDEEAENARRAAVPRYIHQKSFRSQSGEFVEEVAAYVVGEPVMVCVHIGPRRAGDITSNTVFPEDRLPKNRKSYQLQVVFHAPHQFDRPMQDDITLPREGDSSAAKFVFTPRRAGRFEGRITVLHRGRVLQTVLLHAPVMDSGSSSGAAPGITLDDETPVRHDWSDLGRRRPFDLAFVLNHTDAGEALLTGIAGRRAWATRLDGIEQPIRRLNELISNVALSTDDYGDGLDQGENPELLRKLARIGSNLYSLLYRDQLKQLTTDGFDVGDESVTCMQVVSARPDAVVPLEFMYDFNAPDPDATVCPQHREALAAGRCPGNCARTSEPRRHVCPMGFWGLKKVIERHVFDPKAVTPPGAEVTIQVEAMDGRDRLDLSTGALVGHSREVTPEQIATLLDTLNTKTGTAVPVVKDWDEWVATVRTRRPAMLLAFPHNEGKEEDVLLEIGGKTLYTLDLPAEYVRLPDGPPPLVLLLGCDVAGTAQDFSSHVRYFRQAGAAVVVSTIATVFGAHAVRVGEAIVSGLVTPAKLDAPGATRIGEVIRDAKRAALLDSVPMALCVVAFGDADWRL